MRKPRPTPNHFALVIEWKSQGDNLRATHPDDPEIFVDLQALWSLKADGAEMTFVRLDQATNATKAILQKKFDQKRQQERKANAGTNTRNNN